MAVILSNTGIALLAYMDGITDSPTLGGVVLAGAAAAGSAVYKVLFKRVMGDVSLCQLAIADSLPDKPRHSIVWFRLPRLQPVVSGGVVSSIVKVAGKLTALSQLSVNV